MPVIEVRGLTKHYGGQRFPAHHRRETVRALSDLTIDVQEGEIFGFLGPNGAGKSTTIRLLLGFLHPSRGDARALGHDIRQESIAIRSGTATSPAGSRCTTR